MRFLPLLLLAGCGPSFVGIYTGPINEDMTCPDGSGASDTSTARWAISESGGLLQLTTGGTCDPIGLDQRGDVATPKQRACTSVPLGSGVTATDTVASGQLAIGGRLLTVSITSLRKFTGSISTTCRDTVTGTLTRGN